MGFSLRVAILTGLAAYVAFARPDLASGLQLPTMAAIGFVAFVFLMAPKRLAKFVFSTFLGTLKLCLRLISSVLSFPFRARANVDPTNADAFYRSRAWRNLRYRCLATYGRKCMLCKSTSGPFHVDHIKPRSKYPHLALDFKNLQVLCEACNHGKSNTYEDDFRSAA